MTESIQTSSSIPEEWLSAYLDGELSSEERASVETALIESPALQAKLDELRAVSDLLHSLPQPSLGESFAESLRLDLPTRAAARLPWKIGLTTSSLLATSMVAAVLWFQTSSYHESATSSSAERTIAMADRSGAFADAAAEEEMELDSVLAASPAIAMGGAADGVLDGLAFESLEDGYFDRSGRPAPGELLHVLENVDGDVAVVECVVLDVREALDQFEVTLAKLGVEGGSVSEQMPPARGDQLMAVFVNGDESVVQAIMNETRIGRFSVAQNAVAKTAVAQSGLGTPAVAQSEPAARFSVPSAPYSVADPKMSQPAPAATADFSDGVPKVAGIAKPAAVKADDSPSAILSEAAAPMRSRAVANSGDDLSLEKRDARAGQPGRPEAPATAAILGELSPEQRQLAEQEAKESIVNQYQVPLQVTSESLSRIQSSNQLVPSQKAQRLLVVFRQVTPGADPPADSATEAAPN